MSRGIVRIGEKDVDMLCNAATTFIYKRVFGKDFLMTVGTDYIDADGKKKTNIDTNAIKELGYVMHMQTKKTFKELLDESTEEDCLIWLSEFEAGEFDGALNGIMDLYHKQQKTTVNPKKKHQRQSGHSRRRSSS